MTKNSVLFFVALGLHFISYFLHFLDNDLGYEFFQKGLAAFFAGGIRDEEMVIFYAFFAPIVTLPFFAWNYWLRPLFKRKIVEILFFVFFLFLPAALTAFFLVVDKGHLDDDSWGYAAWLISFILFLILYLKKSRQDQEQDDDISKHLVENE